MPKGVYPRKRHPMPRLAYLVAKGWRLRELSEKYGLHRQAILTEIRRRDIPYHWTKGCSGARNGSWKGGRTKGKGYWYLWKPEHPDANRHGYILESRLAMERKLGRRLSHQEVVHHRDGDPNNNKPSNLFLYGSNGQHLADTLKGKVPKWSEAGKRRILEAVRRARRKHKKASRAQRESDAERSL